MENFNLKKYLAEGRLTQVNRTSALDIDGKEIQINNEVELIDANITDGNGTPLPGNIFKVIRVNPKTITLEPTFNTWLRTVKLDSNRVRLL
jgi:hypothetical protein